MPNEDVLTGEKARKIILQQFHFFQLSKPLLMAFGIDVALWIADMLSRMVYFEKREMLSEDGFFYHSQEEMAKTTTLSPERQKKVVDLLKELGMIETKKEGLPLRLHYKIHYENLINIMSDAYDNFKNQESQFPSNAGPSSLQMREQGILKSDTLYNNNKLNNNKQMNVFINKDIKTSYKVLDSEPSEGFTEVKNGVDRSSYKGSATPPPRPAPPPPPAYVTDIITWWETHGLRKSRIDTKVWLDNSHSIRRLFRGIFFNPIANLKEYHGRKFTTSELKTAILRFASSAIDPTYEPSNPSYKKNLKSYSISQFLYNPMTENGDKSFFLKYLNDSPLKASQSIKVKEVSTEHKMFVDPIVKVYKRFYTSKVMGDIKVKLTSQDENNFISGAKKLSNFILHNGDLLKTVQGDEDLAQILCEAIWKNVNEDSTKLSSGWFRSEAVFNRILPSYLTKIGVVHPQEDY